MLLVARDEDGEAMNDRELRDELVTLLVAGHETTATALAWAFELLSGRRACASAQRTLAEGSGDYADAVVKEALRLRPVIAGVGPRGPRRALRARRLRRSRRGPRSTPRSRRSTAAPTATPSRAPSAPSASSTTDAPDTYTWIPFGGGTRRCLGASFALFEMQVVIRRVLERTGLATVGRRPEKGVRRGITFVPAGGVRVRLAASSAGECARTAIGADTLALSARP